MTQNLEAILALFENGERRYDEDPAFKAVCDSLKMGLGVYAVLDHTFKEKQAIRERYNEKAAEWSRAVHDYETTIEKLKERITALENPDGVPFGTCKVCGLNDEQTRMGFDKCNLCYKPDTGDFDPLSWPERKPYDENTEGRV